MDSFLESGNYTLYLTTALSQNTPLGDIVEVLARDGWSKIRKNERDFNFMGFEFLLFGGEYIVEYIDRDRDDTMLTCDFEIRLKVDSGSIIWESSDIFEPLNHKHLQEVLYRKIINHIQTGKPIINPN